MSSINDLTLDTYKKMYAEHISNIIAAIKYESSRRNINAVEINFLAGEFIDDQKFITILENLK